MILVMFLVLNLSGAGIKGASIHCDGWGAVQDNGVVEGYMLTDSRGAAFANTDDEHTAWCHAWKDGYQRKSFWIDIRKDHTKFTITLEEDTE